MGPSFFLSLRGRMYWKKSQRFPWGQGAERAPMAFLHWLYMRQAPGNF